MLGASSKKLPALSRNDWALSGQVVKAASKVVQLGVGLAHFKVSIFTYPSFSTSQPPAGGGTGTF